MSLVVSCAPWNLNCIQVKILIAKGKRLFRIQEGTYELKLLRQRKELTLYIGENSNHEVLQKKNMNYPCTISSTILPEAAAVQVFFFSKSWWMPVKGSSTYGTILQGSGQFLLTWQRQEVVPLWKRDKPQYTKAGYADTWQTKIKKEDIKPMYISWVLGYSWSKSSMTIIPNLHY